MGEFSDLVDVQNRPGRKLVLEQFCFSFDPALVSEPAGGHGIDLDQGVQGVPGPHLLEEGIFVDQPAELVVIALKAKADVVPELVGLPADHHVPVLAGVPGILVQVGVPAAGSAFDTGIEPVPGNIKVDACPSAFQRR